MDNILIIEDNTTNIAKALGVKNRLVYFNQSTDEKITDWLLKGIENLGNISQTIKKIILPCRIGTDDNSFTGIHIGLHIRLTKKLSENIRFASIVFLSAETREEIVEDMLEQNNKNGLFLFTGGVSITEELDIARTMPLELINQEIFNKEVLPALAIEQQKDKGHQLANEWGAFRLAKFAGYRLSIPEPSDLFFKYKDALTQNETEITDDGKIGLLNIKCDALLIDDQAFKGWSDALGFILKKKIINPNKSSKLTVITSFEEANAISSFQEYDVIFLDIRLFPEEDKSNKIVDIEEYSGTKILKKIKNENRGTQVIIFTASNKIWNIDKLKSLGADGYYIKESPEYVLSSKFSKDNFEGLKKSIEKTLQKMPLRDIYKKIEANKSKLNQLKKTRAIDNDFSKFMTIQFDLTYSLIERANNRNDFAIAYIMLFKCIEMINEYYVIENSNVWTIPKISGDDKLKRYSFNSTENPNYFESKPTTFEKIAGLGIQYLGLTPNQIWKLRWNIFRRNEFIHPDKKQLTEKEEFEKNKIYSFEGFVELLESINNIIINLK